MSATDEDWPSYRRVVLDKLQDLREDLAEHARQDVEQNKKLTDTLEGIGRSVGVLKTKAMIAGAILALLLQALVPFLLEALKHK